MDGEGENQDYKKRLRIHVFTREERKFLKFHFKIIRPLLVSTDKIVLEVIKV
jgi:hypothetical protein